MSGLYGDAVSDGNIRLRFCVIVFLAVMGFALALEWRSNILVASEYQDIPTSHERVKVKNQNLKFQKKIQEKLINSDE